MGKRQVKIAAFAVAFAAFGVMSVTIVRAFGPHEESERQVKESETPVAALAALKKLAGNAKLTEFSEEKEHGSVFYEGSWQGTHGKVDALVTVAGDLVELEEAVPVDSVPKAVQDKVTEAAGKDAKLYVEKKTYIMYEVKFRKGDRRLEVLYTPDGRRHEHEEDQGHEEGDED